MAAIDKLYCHSYYEYDDLRRWAIAYYPELLFYFYDITVTYQRWEDRGIDYAINQVKISKRQYEKLGSFSSVSEAEYNLKQHYLKTANYVCPAKQAIYEVKVIIDDYNKTEEDWKLEYSMPVMNTPLSVDRKLLWTCPVPCVREYLEKQCGYKTRWYHKLFWKGKKHFN